MRAREAKKQGVRGGILADKMGYGKTCTAIGLIADTRRLSLAKEPEGPDDSGYYRSDATLILAPRHLIRPLDPCAESGTCHLHILLGAL